MSHIVEIVTEVRDPVAIRSACQRLTLPLPVLGRTKLFSGEVVGWAVPLRDWKYPIVCNTETGTVHYDNYNGVWGDESRLHRFLQMYTIEKSTHSQCTSCYGFSCLVTREDSSHFCLAS